MKRSAPALQSAPPSLAWPENPVLARLWRGGHVESQHRGAWVLVDTSGAVLDGEGDWNHPVFARSATKALQALPLLESGAAEHFGFADDEIAITIASHHGEEQHVRRVAALLARLGLSCADLQCGPQAPVDLDARRALTRADARPSALHNNCSGKHSGFLALALHLGMEPGRYLDRDGAAQLQVRRAVEELSGTLPGELDVAIDGCSAPTFRLPLVRLATALARVANPEGLAAPRERACRRMLAAAERFPELIGGSRHSLCTDLLRASGGKLFAKLGTEAVYVVGLRGERRGFAVKIDDGAYRAMNALVVDRLARLGHLAPAALERLDEWRGGVQRNWAGLETGRLEVVS